MNKTVGRFRFDKVETSCERIWLYIDDKDLGCMYLDDIDDLIYILSRGKEKILHDFERLPGQRYSKP